MSDKGSQFKVCVFAGAAPGTNPEFIACAQELGEQLAQEGFEIIYGGGAVGLMGALADGALQVGGRVVGILPQQLADLELAHTGISEAIVVSAMHERKAFFHQLSQAFVVLPGGVGTFDELFETLAWLKLGIHQKPVILVNSGGYFNVAIKLIEQMEKSGFVDGSVLNHLLVRGKVEDVIRDLLGFRS